MSDATGDPPEMWGTSIIGFGRQKCRYASGNENERFKVGFSPRKQNLTLYIMDGFDRYGALLGELGKHSTGKSCLCVKRLEQVDVDVFKTLVRESVAHIDATSSG